MIAGVIETQPESIPSLDGIDEEVQAGLKHDQERMEYALEADNYFRGQSQQYIDRRRDETEEEFKQRPKRTSKLTGKVVRMLADQIWGKPPQREVEGDKALTDWYGDALARANGDVRILHAYRSGLLAHAAALEIEATGNPDRPVRLWVWRPHEFTVWTRDDDPTDVWAVCTRSRIRVDAKRVRCRYRVWTAFERRTYYTRPYGPNEPAAGKRAEIFAPDESGPSPYPGILPFTFVRAEPAVCEFWEGAIGPAIVEANGYVDNALCDLAQHVAENLNGTKWAKGVPPNTHLQQKVGRFIHLPSDPAARSGDNRIEPELGMLQGQINTDAAWYDLRCYVDDTLESLDIPATMIRTADSATDLSGVAIVAKQVPFIEHARARQPFATETEIDLFARVCGVVGRYHNEAALLAAAVDPKLMLTWPEPKIPLPTPERDTADSWELEHGFTDPIEVLARRRGVTLQQAEEIAAQIAERRATWQALMGDVMQEEAEAKGEQAMAAQGGEQDQPESENV